MKRLLSVLACAVAVLLGSELSCDAQTKSKSRVRRSDQKSKVVAVNTNELEEFPIESGEMKFIASSEETNGAFGLVERTQQACYKTTWHRHDHFEESFYVLEGVWTVQIANEIHEFPAGSFVLIPRGTPHGQGNFTKKPVKLLVLVTPGGFEHFYKDRVESLRRKGAIRSN